MKTLVSLQDIYYSHDSTPLFEGISLSLNQGDRLAIVGHNGCGKSTLLSLLSDKIKPQEGIRTCMRGLKFEVVEQFLPEELENFSLREAVLDKLEKEKRDFESYRVDCVLEDLFFHYDQSEILVKNLSGGQKNRLMIARAIINEPDLVLMDEPTNHLDLKTLLYIEKYFLEKASFSYGIISHDKRFLDKVTNKTIILRDRKSYSFKMPYSQALEKLSKHDENAKKALEIEEKEIRRLKASAKRLAIWGKTFDNEDLAKKAKTMERRVEKLESNKTFVTKGNPYSLDLEVSKNQSKLAVQFHSYPVFYGSEHFEESHLFSIDKLLIGNGERVAILGDNGKGKTTFLKKILQDIHAQRHDELFRKSPNLELGVYDQEQEVLGGGCSLFEEVQRQTGKDNDAVKQSLISAGFSYADHGRPIELLSGGERARIIFLILSLKKPNFLILDEPTNHIDLEGKEELRKMLIEGQATIILTGHDRDFIESVAERFFVIENGQLVERGSTREFYEGLIS